MEFQSVFPLFFFSHLGLVGYTSLAHIVLVGLVLFPEIVTLGVKGNSGPAIIATFF